MAAPKVIVFGPSGAVGSATARAAHELGAKVVLAMRDTKKPIPGLDEVKVKDGSFERVQADLHSPDTVRDAVSSTQATRAFIYIAHGSSDNMKSTILALKSAGIDLVVLLSSFTIQGEPEDVKPSEVIPYIHAQVEITLKEVFGPGGYIAARPGSFASNTIQYKAGFESGLVKIFAPDATVDGIAPEDIGRACGTVLVKGPLDENTAMYLYGPQLISQADCVKTLAKVLGKSPTIETMEREEAYKKFTEERRWPAPLVEYAIKQSEAIDPARSLVFGYPVGAEQLSSVEKYTGQKAMTFEEWAEQHKQMFIS
ncbi:uncharacterized protein PV07_05963 [Cladophialophora immunda]|uniref:NmrA-like domain-containing protein n=1 Tax=Cladophialophora immunda TaxID=569365 RepID=A0A0D2D3A9_9EURO|nr:uncharacterized protein PV07_05963 [Cladophialophora immunda]KIW30204.1 hypothetical protein PV07_05963 [Cladophialophora immunda]OQU95848.1 hypothetical protein CLAIMM_02013 [Cladophialophora immunda]